MLPNPEARMKITCESCSAQYDLDDSRIPASGMSMKCPACLHTFEVRRQPAQAAAAPEPPPAAAASIALSDEGIALSIDDEIDLPAPKETELTDLPAPKAAGKSLVPPPRPPPAPKLPPPSLGLSPPPPSPKPSPPPPSPSLELEPVPGVLDLPAPVSLMREPDIIDLPAPRASGGQHPSLREDSIDLPAPKRPSSVGIDLDAPELEDLAPETSSMPGIDAPIDLEGIDVVAPQVAADDLLTPLADQTDLLTPLADQTDLLTPKADGTDLLTPKADGTDLLTPKADGTDLLTPKADGTDLLTPKIDGTDLLTPKPGTPEAYDVAPKPETFDLAPRPDGAAPEARGAEPSAPTEKGQKKGAPKARPKPDGQARAGRSRLLLAIAGGALLVGVVGVSLGLFTNTGYFGANLFSGKRAAAEAQLQAARKLLADDTLGSYRKAALGLKPLLESDPKNRAAAGLEAQAHLGAARLGNTADTKAADALLAKLDADPDAAEQPEVEKARALRAVVAGKVPEARLKLSAVLSRAPSDATALVVLGWLELGTGDWPAAERAFAKAAAAEPTRAAAQYGVGVAKERQGDFAAADEAYGRALVRSPSHFGAAVGQARVGSHKARGTETQTGEARVQEMIDKRASLAGPREVADAWASLGLFAAAAGRREEAEDRLKRALALDADSSVARVALAKVQCDTGRAAEARAPLKKLVAAQPNNLEARLGWVRALLEGGSPGEAPDALAPAVAKAPKDARVLYWRGRVALAPADGRPNRDEALARFKAAMAADPKLIPVYLAESSLFSQMGKPEAALDALKQAEAQAADDPQLMTELGEAYLALGRVAEAEARFREALGKRPDRFATRIDLGIALEGEGKLDEARAEYDAIEKQAPNFPGLAERQAHVAAAQGRKDDAYRLFQVALKQGVPTHPLRVAAGELALDMGKADEARELGEAVLKEDDRSAAAFVLTARAQLALGRPDEALIMARRAATLSDKPEMHLVLGQVLETLHKYDQAVAEYQLARRPPVEAVATLGRARIMVRMGAARDALADLNELVRDNKLRAQALLLAGDCWADLQQPDKARHAYEDALRFGPQIGEAAFKYGRALHDAGRRKPAIEILQRAVSLGEDKAPWSAEAHLLLGDAHRESKENADAVRAYRRYLDLAPPDAPQRSEVTRHISLLGGT
jgi:predicted Zn finger-like uncharacterized protein